MTTEKPYIQKRITLSDDFAFRAVRFTDPTLAKIYAARQTVPAVAVLGTFPHVWVVHPDTAAKLEALGYELVP